MNIHTFHYGLAGMCGILMLSRVIQEKDYLPFVFLFLAFLSIGKIIQKQKT
jgi:hypothetical protein